MNDLVNTDLHENITLALLRGENPDTLQKSFNCDLSLIYQIMAGNVFSERVKEYLEKDIQISGLAALRNIKAIAAQEGISKATQLKANQWIAEKALELNRLGVDSHSPATMTQDQLSRRLIELQKEAIKRAKPINTGVIDQSPINMDDML
jgi:hypothetical protein